MIKIIDAKFLISSPNINKAPPPDIAEVVFLGRSNVGKSSLLNSLTKQKNLAKSSSTPGKTRLINLFDIKFKDYNNNSYLYARFTDLPGFGYAKVSKSLKDDWGKNLTEYIQKRSSIRIFIHLIDARHISLDIDNRVREFLYSIKRADQIVLEVYTKVDKLKQKELAKLPKDSIKVSNLKKKGIDKLESKIVEFLFGNS